VYGPIRSEPVTLCRLGDPELCIDPFLEGGRLLGARRRDRVHGRSSA
jgi:hypothetical protein